MLILLLIAPLARHVNVVAFIDQKGRREISRAPCRDPTRWKTEGSRSLEYFCKTGRCWDCCTLRESPEYCQPFARTHTPHRSVQGREIDLVISARSYQCGGHQGRSVILNAGDPAIHIAPVRLPERAGVVEKIRTCRLAAHTCPRCRVLSCRPHLRCFPRNDAQSICDKSGQSFTIRASVPRHDRQGQMRWPQENPVRRSPCLCKHSHWRPVQCHRAVDRHS